MITFNTQEEFEAAVMATINKVKPPSPTYVWECNECGSQEYTMCVSEDDVHNLGCGSCGGDEWHKAIAKD